MTDTRVHTIPWTFVVTRRTELGLAQRDLAERIGIKPSYMSLIESGQRGVRPYLLKRLAHALEVTVAELMATRPGTEKAA